MRQFCLILLLCSTAIGGNSAVAVLVNRLGDGRYAVRERASASLAGMMPQAESYLKDASSHPNKEIAVRSELLVSKYHREQAVIWSEKILPDKYARMPWIDKLPLDVPNRDGIMSWHLSKAYKVTAGYQGWPAYRVATKLYVKDLIGSGRTKKEIVQLLNRMADVEIKWIREYGQKYVPPIELPE